MEIFLFANHVHFELKITEKLTVYFSRLIETKIGELFQFKGIKIPYRERGEIQVLINNLKTLYSESNDINSISEVEFIQIFSRDEENETIAFFELNRKEDLPIKFEVDFYYKRAQSPKDHIILKEDPFLIIYNNYIYFNNDFEIKCALFQKFIESQYENMYLKISEKFSFFQLKRKYIQNADLLQIYHFILLEENDKVDYSHETVQNFLIVQKIRYLIKKDKIVFVPVNSVVIVIKTFLGIRNTLQNTPHIPENL
ncbi:hypothetical protein EHQ24_19115 [Leptospira noumeaensis]|uniref:Uncharacterized protein n=1 Tax=Leptospira noumeaensis TaxID=2484964 RepID=A0A4V3JIX4_9LEPT|nr:hypothetical protein [Leptospira noumeaensis]TGK77517.1 hypothetical protein EHQ24_19115 [Leptospira noumeaensis]